MPKFIKIKIQLKFDVSNTDILNKMDIDSDF